MDDPCRTNKHHASPVVKASEESASFSQYMMVFSILTEGYDRFSNLGNFDKKS